MTQRSKRRKHMDTKTAARKSQAGDGRVLIQMKFRRDLAKKVRAAAQSKDLTLSAWIRLQCLEALSRADTRTAA
jgi:hypothetical protein